VHEGTADEYGDALRGRQIFLSLAGRTFLSEWALEGLVLPIRSPFSVPDASVRGFHFANFRQFCYETRLTGFIKPLRRPTSVSGVRGSLTFSEKG
jgi:hypothetical protein